MKDPVSSVTVVRTTPVSVCVVVISTPGSTAPLESFTVPLTCAVACAQTGLQALDYLGRGQRPPSGWAAQQMGMLQQALKPGHAQLLLMVAAPVESLVRASAGMSATASRNKRPWAVGGKR